MKIQFKLKNGTVTLKEAVEILNDYLGVRSGKLVAVHSKDGTYLTTQAERERQIVEAIAEVMDGEKKKSAQKGKIKVRKVK